MVRLSIRSDATSGGRRLQGAVALALWLAGAAGVPAASAAARPTLLLIVVDTLRASAVSAYGSVTGTTPQMDALARDGLLGLVQTCPPRFEPGSDVANMTICGYDPSAYHTGRAPWLRRSGVRGAFRRTVYP